MTEVRLKRILWRCRRGTRELDAILSGFAKSKYPILNDELSVQFDRLLEEQDSDLADWLNYEEQPPSVFKDIVERILLYKNWTLVAQNRLNGS